MLCNSSRGVWDPERWHLDRKRSETPPEDERGVRGDLPVDHKVLIVVGEVIDVIGIMLLICVANNTRQ